MYHELQINCNVLAHRCSCSYILDTEQCVCVLSARESLLCISFTAVECPALQPIPNGAITYGPDTIAPFDEGTVATHSCNDGFTLGAGSEVRTCLAGGR